ncbi:Hrp-dependent type III effector protein, partial [Pseudomonas sp. GP01-A3]
LYVDSSTENRENTAKAGKQLGLTPSEVSNRISKGLGEIASELVKNNSFVSGLVLTGGDTAKDVCLQIGASGLGLLK